MRDKILELIQLIIWYASDFEINLTRLRLVKFLYLADLYYAREKSGQTFTNLPWAFVYYGPYCGEALREIDNAVKKGLIEEKAYESQYEEKDYYLYRSITEEEPSIGTELPTYMISELKWAIKNWGEDTEGLLDHVYFETEPMINAKRGNILDFSLALKPRQEVTIKMKKLSLKKLRFARETISKLRDKTLAVEKAKKYIEKIPLYDKSYLDFLSLIEEPDVDIGLKGVAEIKGLNNKIKS